MVRKAKGFTLIELMIAVAIIGILAAIAIPQYSQYLIKSRRAAAKAFMVDVADREKQYFLDKRDYAVDPGAVTAVGLTVPPDVSRFYNVTVAAGAATPSFVITATPINTGAQASDGPLTLDDAGDRTPVGKW